MLKVVVLISSERQGSLNGQFPFGCVVLQWDEHRLQVSRCFSACDSVKEG